MLLFIIYSTNVNHTKTTLKKKNYIFIIIIFLCFSLFEWHITVIQYTLSISYFEEECFSENIDMSNRILNE